MLMLYVSISLDALIMMKPSYD